MALLELDNVNKTYGRIEALKSISLEVERGSVGLLGPNGAGKSTLIRILLGLLDNDRGVVRILGKSPKNVRSKAGYMPEHDCHLPEMSAIQYVSYFGQLSGLPRSESMSRAHETLEYVGLKEARYRQMGEFSAGMKQRAKLAQAIVHSPEVVFLDEPTNGLDPDGRDEMLSLVRDIHSREISIILSSHILPDVEEVCDKVIILKEGELRYAGEMKQLSDREASVIEVKTNGQDDTFKAILSKNDFDVQKKGGLLEIESLNTDRYRDVFELARGENIQIRHFVPSHLTLENAFLDLMEDSPPTG